LVLIAFDALSNPINNYDLSSEINTYNFFVEIPAGTKQKWEVNKNTGNLEWEEKKGKKRVINFINYPGNYGFIPQTLAGDGDPVDVVDLEEAIQRGEITKVKILGGMYFKDGKEEDIKFIAVANEGGIFSNYSTIEELFLDKPSVIEILKKWFESYKSPGKMIFYRFLGKEESEDLISQAHKRWIEKNIKD